MPARVLLVFLCSLLASQTPARQSCPPIPVTPPDRSALLFSPQQENDLGDIISEHMQNSFLVIDEDDMNDYLRKVSDRVVRELPETNLHFQFFLYDQPQVQAFGIPGGRVYVSRKMVAFLRDEDELAGVLGHELGHLVMRQAGTRLSVAMQQALGIESVSDREDLYDKYNRFMESYRLKKIHAETRAESDRDQMIADRIGIEATARAGYSPQAFVDAIDRLLQTKGKTGNWLSDLFGTTKPDSRRLREVLKDVDTLPASCRDSRPRGTSDDFHRWQDAVLHYNGIGHKQHLHDVLQRQTFRDPLRPDIYNFRFSPDGKYIVAQDEGGVNVLSRDPFALKFRFDAPYALAAQFSPDSRDITFATPDFRVEAWNVSSQERTSVSDVPVLHGCIQLELSPDGKFLSCFGWDYDLTVFDVADGREMFHKDSFFDPDAWGVSDYLTTLLRLSHDETIVTLRFSPDSRYFAAVAPGADPTVLELPDGHKVEVPSGVRDALRFSFAFLGPDRLLGINAFDPRKSPIVGFPHGGVFGQISLNGGSFSTATNRRYLLVRPVKDHPVGVLDLQENRFVFANRNSAMDICGESVIDERLNGEIGLYKLGETKPSYTLQLPLGNLARLTTFAVSPDLHWLAVSVRTRGAIFDLQKNERIFFGRGFSRSFSVSPEIFYLSFPKLESSKPELLAFSGATHRVAERVLEEKDDIVLLGKVSVHRKQPENTHSPSRNVTFEVIETEKGNLLWRRTFRKRAPDLRGSNSPGRMILTWPADSDGAKDELANNPALKDKVDLRTAVSGDYVLEVLDASAGNLIGGLLVRTGKGAFRIESADSVGDWLILADTNNRILLYSLSTGQIKARYFGTAPVFSANGSLLAVANNRGQLRIYDLKTLQRLDDLAFSTHIIMDAFSSDASKLLVLTSDQTGYILDMTKLPAPKVLTIGPGVAEEDVVSGVRKTGD